MGNCIGCHLHFTSLLLFALDYKAHQLQQLRQPENGKLLFVAETNCKHISLIGNIILSSKQNILAGYTLIRIYIYVYICLYIYLGNVLLSLFYIIHRFNDLISSTLINPKGNLLLLGNLEDEK